MNPFETFRVAVRALLRNKMRSFLTMLGVIIGVAAVIAMVAIGEGAKQKVEEAFASMGSDLLILMSGATTRGGASGGFGSLPTITWDDLAAIRTEVPAVRGAALRFHFNPQVAFVCETDLNGSGLGDDGGIGFDMGDQVFGSDTPVFFIRNRGDNDIAPQPDARILKRLRRRDLRRERSLHVIRAAAVELPVAHRGLEGIALPFLERAGGHYVGVPRETQHRPAFAARGPEIVDVPITQVFDLETEAGEPSGHDFLAALVGWGHGIAGDEIEREVDGG